MNARFLSLLTLLLAALLSLPAFAVADEPVKTEPKYGVRAGETMPFFVVDFCHGEHKDSGGCPGVIISNHEARGVILLVRAADENALALAKALEAKVIDGEKVLGFVVLTGEHDAALADKAAKGEIKKTSVGTIRNQSLQTLKKFGLSDDIAVAAVLMDGKAVMCSYLLKAGELTPEKRQELVAAAEAWSAAAEEKKQP